MNAPDFDDDRDDGAGGGEGFLSQLPVILWQRRWWIGIPLVAGALAAVAAIFLLPTTYRSTAVLLVQSPQLSGDVIGGLPDNSIDRRIARIREQVTSRPDLLAHLAQRLGGGVVFVQPQMIWSDITKSKNSHGNFS